MAKISFSGFKDPARRPRYVIIAGTLVLGLAATAIVVLGATSSYWFCAECCHQVQDDTIEAYRRSNHSEISCMACHMPAGAGPLTFLLHKAEKAGELYKTLTGTFGLPLNVRSALALEMPTTQCTQCHGPNRPITPSKGIVIDHEAHSRRGIGCTVCHNRVAHVEDFRLKLKDPKTGEANRPHEDFMKMRACYRCHGLDERAAAPGKCSACHPKGFDLKPVNHDELGFYGDGGPSKGHARLAVKDAERTRAAARARKGAEEAFHAGGMELKPMEELSYCGTCHERSTFCDRCHGVEMPHPEGFSEKHGDVGRSKPYVCANCHRTEAGGTEFCNNCHHKGSDASRSWLSQHREAVRQNGAQSCLQRCHSPTYCAVCHVRGIR